MQRGFLIPIIGMLILLAAQLAQAETPAEFLDIMLRGDFNGEKASRMDHVYYSDGVYEIFNGGPCDCGGGPRDVINIESYPLFVVSGFEVMSWRMTSRHWAEVKVRFRVLATSRGKNYDRIIIPYRKPHHADITFKVLRKNDLWLWVDPPKRVYVGFDALDKAMRRLVDVEQNIIAEYEDDPSAHNRDAVLSLRRKNKRIYQAQIDALDSLRPLLPIGQP